MADRVSPVYQAALDRKAILACLDSLGWRAEMDQEASLARLASLANPEEM